METWQEPGRDLPVLARPDVLVVGAGSAGIAAAIAAARRGAEVWLIERLGSVGGLATGGLINLLLSLDDGDGNQVVAGICQELVARLAQRDAARFPPREEWGSEDAATLDGWRRWGLVWGAPPEVVRYSVAFDPEAFVDVAYEMLREAGVTLRLDTYGTAAWLSGDRIEAVAVESKAGRQVLLPTIVIDTTGDADLAVLAGADTEHVEIWPHLWFRMGGVSWADVDATGGLFFRTTADGRVLVPWGGPGLAPRKIDPVDPAELTWATLECRERARSEAERLCREAPGFEDAWLDDYARLLGITESRRLVGDCTLTKEDADRRFEDCVARTGHWTVRGVVYEIPYRCLTTPAVSNLLVAGRCISTTRYVHQATKEIPAALATGEAAGCASVHALDRRGDVREVDVGSLRRDLAAAGADVGRTGSEPQL